MDRLSTPVLEFAFDAAAKRVLFQGGHHLDGASFDIVEALIEDFRDAKRQRAEVPFVSARKLTSRLRISEPSIRQQIGRLRKALEPLTVLFGIPMENNTFIENRDGDGYRLNPEWREISVGDIRIETRILTQAK